MKSEVVPTKGSTEYFHSLSQAHAKRTGQYVHYFLCLSEKFQPDDSHTRASYGSDLNQSYFKKGLSVGLLTYAYLKTRKEHRPRRESSLRSTVSATHDSPFQCNLIKLS